MNASYNAPCFMFSGSNQHYSCLILVSCGVVIWLYLPIFLHICRLRICLTLFLFSLRISMFILSLTNITWFLVPSIWRGGIVFWADTVGAGYIYSRLKKWAEIYGGFFKPSSYLEERANKGLPLVLNLVILWSNPSLLHFDFFQFPALFCRAN